MTEPAIIIKETIKELFQTMKLEAQVEIEQNQPDNLLVNIQTEEAGFLIGQEGGNLDAFQHLARVLAGKKYGQPVQFVVDINNYRKHRIELLKELAKNMAKQALMERVSLTLQPMSSYERRIIHLALAGESQISTKSIGQDSERRIVIKPIK
ncbi:MAG: R3H domain-containing nucleic acid-binding protein [Patescibacteria group bacterium]